jgi:hypothetical protein
MQPYIPVNVLEAINEERRADPRVIAAAGYPLSPFRRKPRHSLGNLLIRLGRLIEGTGKTTTSASPSVA